MTTPLPILARCSGETPGGPCRLGKDSAPAGGAHDQAAQAPWISRQSNSDDAIPKKEAEDSTAASWARACCSEWE
jgi:hypothetical protein